MPRFGMLRAFLSATSMQCVLFDAILCAASAYMQCVFCSVVLVLFGREPALPTDIGASVPECGKRGGKPPAE